MPDAPPEFVHIAADYRQPMTAAGWVRFDAVVDQPQGELLRQRSDRENWRLAWPSNLGPARHVYLKRHSARTVGSVLRALLQLGPGRNAGRTEADRITSLKRDGVPTLSLVAFGERLSARGQLDSFLLTEELAGYTPLDEFLAATFSGRTSRQDPRLKKLIEQVADLAAQFHRLGYNHRDFYACHFFVREVDSQCFDVRLIDLQRVERRRQFRCRWIVKDLAQLMYSTMESGIGAAERLAFCRRYFAVRRMGPVQRRILRAVTAKVRRMTNRLGTYSSQ